MRYHPKHPKYAYQEAKVHNTYTMIFICFFEDFKSYAIVETET